MSVNGISSADQQQQGNKTGAAIGTGVSLGVLGAGAGYMWGGKTPSLEEVFAQEPDTFEAAKTKMAEKDATAAETVKTEYDALQAELEPKTSEVKAKQNAVDEHIKANYADFDNKEALNKDVSDAKTKLATEKEVTIGESKQKVKYDSLEAYKTDKKELADAQKALADAGEDAAKKEAAQARIDKVQPKVEAFKAEAEALENAEKAVFDAKKAKFMADESDAAKGLRTGLEEAQSALKTAKNEAIGKLKDKNTLTEAFGKVKKALIKGKGKAAAIYGAIAAAVGLAVGYMFSRNKEA